MRYQFESYELDTETFELKSRGTPVHMEPQVFDVLSLLLQNHDRVVSKDEVMEKVWGDKFISEAALNSRVMAARKAIGDSGREQRLIKTVRGRGFRFVGEVRTPAVMTLEAASGTEVSEASKEAESGPSLRQQIGFCTAQDGVRIAYAIVGRGPVLVKAPNWLTHIEYEWESPVWRHWWEELARDHTVVRFDQRGCGLSDWDVEDLSFEAWVRDLEAVVDALGLDRFDLLGISQGGAVAVDYTACHPERVSKLVLYGTYSRGWLKRGQSLEEHRALLTLTREGWGRDNPAYRQLFTMTFMPEATPDQYDWFNQLQLVSTSPENAFRIRSGTGSIDVVEQLQRIKAQTLVLHARGDERVPFNEGRLIASLIPGARFVGLDSRNHLTLASEPAWQHLVSEVRAFLDADGDALPEPSLTQVRSPSN